SELCRIFQKAAQVDLFQVKVARPGEIHESLHDAIQPSNLAVNNVHVALSVGLLLGQLVAQQLQVQHDGVDGILDFVGDAAGEASAGGKAARHFDLVADALDRFGVAHDQQSADLGVLLLDEVERYLHALSASCLELAFRERPAALESVEQSRPQARIAVKYFLNRMTKQFGARAAEKSLHRSADQDHAGIAGEKHQAILQFGHKLIHVVLEGGENFSAIANLPAQIGNLQGDQTVLIVAGRSGVEFAGVARNHAVEIAVDFFQGAEGEIGDAGGKQQGEEDGNDREIESMHQLYVDLALQKDRRYANADADERLAVQPHVIIDVIDRGRTVNQTKLVAETRALHLLEIRPWRNDFADHGSIGVEQSLAVGPNNGSVHNEDPTAPGVLQHVVQIRIRLQVLDQLAPDCDRVAGVKVGAAEIGRFAFHGISQLVGELSGGL